MFTVVLVNNCAGLWRFEELYILYIISICGSFISQLEIRSVEQGICPIATLYSLAAAFQCSTLL